MVIEFKNLQQIDLLLYYGGKTSWYLLMYCEKEPLEYFLVI